MNIKIEIDTNGQLQLITQDGDFESGKMVLEALLNALQANGVDARPVGQVETHHHDVAMTFLNDRSARLHLNTPVTEDGPPHTH